MVHYLELHQGFSIDFIENALEEAYTIDFVMYEDEIQKTDEDNFAVLSIAEGSVDHTEPEYIMLLIDMIREEWAKQKYTLFIAKKDRKFNASECFYEDERSFIQERDKRWSAR